MLPYTTTDIIRLTHQELDRDLERSARLYPNGFPTSPSRRFPTFRFGRKRRPSSPAT